MIGTFTLLNVTLRRLLGNGTSYTVPFFQRDYAWDSSEWEELWADILAVTENEAEDEHYMGYLVVQTQNEKDYDIIDGQQRMTTASIIILAAISYLNDLSQLKIRASEHLLRRAFGFFKERISEYSMESGENCAYIVNVILDKLYFTLITVEDDINAFKVFEALNARGIKLSSSDLLKNYLFTLKENIIHPNFARNSNYIISLPGNMRIESC